MYVTTRWKTTNHKKISPKKKRKNLYKPKLLHTSAFCDTLTTADKQWVTQTDPEKTVYSLWVTGVCVYIMNNN